MTTALVFDCRMGICGYLVIPAAGAATRLGEVLATVPGCDVVRAQNRDLFLVVTDTPTAQEERAMRDRLEALQGIRALVLTFGEVPGSDPDA